MYFQRRGNKYSFIYYDTKRKKNVRLKSSEIPSSIRSDEGEMLSLSREDRIQPLPTTEYKKGNRVDPEHRWLIYCRPALADQNDSDGLLNTAGAKLRLNSSERK